MPQNTTIVLIRHGEKPPKGNTGLSVAGQERAQAYSIFFQNFPPGTKKPLTWNFIFASKDSKSSDRPVLTITPTSKAIGVKINSKHADKDYAKVASDILTKSKYNNSNILICWHHGKLLDLAQSLGVNPANLPPSATWPTGKWPENVFGWYVQITFDGNGNIVPASTFCRSTALMFDDNGQNPPGGNS